MENKFEEDSCPSSDQFLTLFQRIIRLRYKFLVPDHTNPCKQQVIDSLQNSKMDNTEDYRIIIRVFGFLASREKPPTMGEISFELNTSLSTATRIIDWLVHREIVERVSDPNDRRVVRICMSETGRKIYKTYLDHNRRKIEQLMSHFTPEEQTQYLRLTGKLLDLLMAERESAGDADA